MKILVIEDEVDILQTIVDYLERDGFRTETAGDYAAGLDKALNYQYDCILLDIMLPGGSGLDILKTMATAGKIPSVLILSAKDAVEDKVLGLEIGADDYLAKPFHMSELIARMKSIIRRKSRDGDQYIGYKNVVLDPDFRRVTIAGAELILNRKEYDLLYYFMLGPGKLMEKTNLAESVWGDYIDQADNLDFIYSQIKNLRKKLKEGGAEVDIQAVYGLGYKLI